MPVLFVVYFLFKFNLILDIQGEYSDNHHSVLKINKTNSNELPIMGLLPYSKLGKPLKHT